MNDTTGPDGSAAAAAPKPAALRFDSAAAHAEALFAGLDLAAAGAPSKLRAAHGRAVSVAARAAARRGVALPLHDFLSSARLDALDRTILLALLRAAVEGVRLGALGLADLAAAARAGSLPERLALRRRLEETSALRGLGLLESDADAELENRRYRLAPSAVDGLLPGGRPEVESAAAALTPEQTLLAALGAANSLASLPELVARGVNWWSTPIPGAPGWDRFGTLRAELARHVEALAAGALGPVGRLLAEKRLEGPEAIAFLLLFEAAGSGKAGLPAALLAGAAFPAGGSADPVAALGPEGRLAREGLVALSGGDAPFAWRNLSLAPAVREALGLPAPSRAAAKESDDDEGPISERSAPRHRLADVVLPPAARREVDELLFRLGDGGAVLREWGLASGAAGAAALLFGPPGTGKTYTAEALAAELGRPLVRLRVESALSRWVGQGERRVAAAFRDAAAENAVLLLDEADALLVDRAEARPWQVPLVNVLLVEIERYPGLVVLATNRAAALDPALERRLALRLELLPPGEAERRELWRRNLPPNAPLAADVDLAALARDHALTGSGIRRACAKAALRAAARPAPDRLIAHADLAAAAREDAPSAPARSLGFRREEGAARPEPRLLRVAA